MKTLFLKFLFFFSIFVTLFFHAQSSHVFAQGTGYCYTTGTNNISWELYSSGVTSEQCTAMIQGQWFPAPQTTPPTSPPQVYSSSQTEDCFVNGQIIGRRTQTDCRNQGGSWSAAGGAAPAGPIRFDCGAGLTPVINSDNVQVGCERGATQQAPQTCTGPNCGNLGYVPLEPIGFDLSGIQNTNQNAFGEWLSFLLKIAISVGGLIAVVMLVFGGVVYMVSEVVDKKHEAMERIQASFLGLFILIASWLILNTINPQLVTGTNFFRITPTSTSGNIIPANPSAPQTQQSIQNAVNECLARSSSRTCVYIEGPNGPECRC